MQANCKDKQKSIERVKGKYNVFKSWVYTRNWPIFKILISYKKNAHISLILSVFSACFDHIKQLIKKFRNEELQTKEIKF